MVSEKCPECGKELNEDERKSGRCSNCGMPISNMTYSSLEQKTVPQVTSKEEKENDIGKILKIIGGCIILVGFVSAFLLAKNDYGDVSFILFMIYFCVGLVSGTLIIGFGEVITLLDSINNKMDGFAEK